jgi:hypothetical protein
MTSLPALTDLIPMLIARIHEQLLQSACNGYWIEHEGARFLVTVCVQTARIGTDMLR